MLDTHHLQIVELPHKLGVGEVLLQGHVYPNKEHYGQSELVLGNAIYPSSGKLLGIDIVEIDPRGGKRSALFANTRTQTGHTDSFAGRDSRTNAQERRRVFGKWPDEDIGKEVATHLEVFSTIELTIRLEATDPDTYYRKCEL